MPLYLVGFERDINLGGDSKEFKDEYGVKLVRCVQVTNIPKTSGEPKVKDLKAFRKVAAAEQAEEEYEISVELDPVQYKQDLEMLVVSKSKFLEDIYSSDCQLVISLGSFKSHSSNVQSLRLLRDHVFQNLPEWLEGPLLGGREMDPSDNIQILKGSIEDLETHFSTLKETRRCERVLYLSRNDATLNQAMKLLGSSSKHVKIMTPFTKKTSQFSLSPQVSSLIAKRQHLLKDAVSLLASSLDYKVFQEYTCERAGILFRHHLKPLWDAYVLSETELSFPFSQFFLKYLNLESVEELSIATKEKAEELWNIIETIFQELEEIAPFENLRNDKERQNYLLCTQPFKKEDTKLIGMTLEDVKVKNAKLTKIGFTYDTLVIDETLQQSELELLFSLFKQ